MAILTDGKHLMSDKSIDELHEFAIIKLGFKVAWFQNDKNHPHYDLTTKKAVQRALNGGAILVEPKELVVKCGRRYKEET